MMFYFVTKIIFVSLLTSLFFVVTPDYRKSLTMMVRNYSLLIASYHCLRSTNNNISFQYKRCSFSASPTTSKESVMSHNLTFSTTTIIIWSFSYHSPHTLTLENQRERSPKAKTIVSASAWDSGLEAHRHLISTETLEDFSESFTRRHMMPPEGLTDQRVCWKQMEADGEGCVRSSELLRMMYDSLLPFGAHGGSFRGLSFHGMSMQKPTYRTVKHSGEDVELINKKNDDDNNDNYDTTHNWYKQHNDEVLKSDCLPTAFNTDLGLEDAEKGTFTDPDAQRDELFPNNTEKPYVGYMT